MGVPRTSEPLVKEVLGKDYDTSKKKGNRSLAPSIDTANNIVNNIVGLDAATMELIERWMAACIYCMMDRPFASRSVGGSSASYMGQTDKGWDSNPYGQNAKRIDTTGYLWRTDMHAWAGVTWLGLTESEQLDYDQRN